MPMEPRRSDRNNKGVPPKRLYETSDDELNQTIVAASQPTLQPPGPRQEQVAGIQMEYVLAPEVDPSSCPSTSTSPREQLQLQPGPPPTDRPPVPVQSRSAGLPPQQTPLLAHQSRRNDEAMAPDPEATYSTHDRVADADESTGSGRHPRADSPRLQSGSLPSLIRAAPAHLSTAGSSNPTRAMAANAAGWTPHDSGAHADTTVAQMAHILELQHRIQTMQRSLDCYREANAVHQRNQEMCDSVRRRYEQMCESMSRLSDGSAPGSLDPCASATDASATTQPAHAVMLADMGSMQTGGAAATLASNAHPPPQPQHAQIVWATQPTQPTPSLHGSTTSAAATYAHIAPAVQAAATLPQVALQSSYPNPSPYASSSSTASATNPQPGIYTAATTALPPTASYYVSTYSQASGASANARAGTSGPAQSSSNGPNVRGAASGFPPAADHGAPFVPQVNAYRRIVDLPTFNGRPEEWPFFICSYEETTRHYGYTALENMGRLQKALVGDAKTRAQGILIRPEHVQRTVEILAKAFGRPEMLADSQLAKIRKLQRISENRPDQLISFSMTVDGMVSLLDGPATDHLLTNALLLKELTSKLPTNDQRIWAGVARHIGPNPSIRDFALWLADAAEDVAQIRPAAVADSVPVRSRESKPAASKSRHVLMNVASRSSASKAESCSFCAESHPIVKCEAYLKLKPLERLAETRKRPLCYGCLGDGHLLPGCDMKQFCGYKGCQRRHHHLLHRSFEESDTKEAARPTHPEPDQQRRGTASKSRRSRGRESKAAAKPAASADRNASQDPPEPQASGAVLNCQGGKLKPTLLYRIIPVVLHGPHRKLQTFALLDEGSSVSLIDADVAAELQLDGESQQLNLQFVGGASSTQRSQKVGVGISGTEPGAVRYDVDSIQTAKDLALPTQTVDGAEVLRENPHVIGIPFSKFENAQPKVLLGLEHHFLGIPLEMRTGTHRQSVAAARTKLGWVLYGSSGGATLPGAVVLHARRSEEESSAEKDRLEQLHELVRQHFTTEEFGVKLTSGPIQSDSDKRAMQLLTATTKRVGERFETGLLWSRDDVMMPNNFDMALRRLCSVEAKMRRDRDYATMYRQEIQGYLDKGYARELSVQEASVRSPRTWHLPHFAVLNPNKPGKFRLVFDAAATVNNVSLNSVLLAGPDLNMPLTRLLFRFRVGRIGVTADVKEMFHQVAVRTEDQESQRFLWRDGDANAIPKVYVMTRMTFGSSCSPTSAQFVKNANARELAGRFPEAADAVINNHYVDDFVASFPNSDDAQRITGEVIEVQRLGGFELRGVVSNCAAVMERFGTRQEHGREVSLEPADTSQKILGMVWDTNEDVFVFQTRFQRVHPAVMDGSRRPTKRELLSVAMSIFDPFGLLADFLLPTKVILQELWRRGVQWDDPIPESVNARWQEWRAQVAQTHRVRVPRCYSASFLDHRGLQLHVFADASEEAFAAVAYWRVEGQDGVELALIAGKVRCAPLKILSVPRLELQAAVLATRLMEEIKRSHEEVRIDKTVFWTDSETVLKWLRCDQRRYVPFVAFRVAEVVEQAPADCWRWVPTALNVADDATRVKSTIVFDPQSRWLLGPAWLKEDASTWPEQKGHGDPDEAPSEELRPKFVGAIAGQGVQRFERFSRFVRLVRCAAWMRRFLHNSRQKPGGRRCGELEVAEVERATLEVCRQVQLASFKEEIGSIEAGLPIPHRSKLLPLKPYLDGDGVLRVHGRTDAADDEFITGSARRPIIMPQDHRVTELIVRHHHELCAHQMTDAVMAAVRVKFWVPGLRVLVRKVQRSCQTCRYRNVSPMPTFQGQLPADRLLAYARPFTNTGMDYFGPFHVTIGRRKEKRWVALFTCMVTRAVHLEVAADLSTDACLVCIRNLCHLRGVPTVIRCDNGTNFVGARNELARDCGFIDPEVMQQQMSVAGITWKLNCPQNPEAGGAWERLVQSVKRVLRVIMQEEAPRVETFRALLLEASNVVNSRPLTHVPVTPEDPEPLTPNHFLMGGPNVVTAPNPADEGPISTRKQWQLCRELSRKFWRQFVRDYMPELTRRSKYYPEVPPLRVGDLVIVCDPQLPRGKWPRGVIIDVATAEDGAVRTATVRTAHGEIRRPATRLAKLEIGPSGGVDVQGAVSSTTTPV